MKRLLSLVLMLALLSMTILTACPAPVPTPEGGGTTTTTTSSTSGNSGGSTGNQPTAPLSVTPASPYYLVGDVMTFTVTGAEGGLVVPTFFPQGSSADFLVSGNSIVTATATAAGVHEVIVSVGERTAKAVVTVFSADETTLPATDPLVRILGRTEQNASGDILLNNTASGFEVTFFGTELSVNLCNGTGKSDTAKLAVYIDGVGDPAIDVIDLRTAGVAAGDTRKITLATFAQAGLHTVRVQKITQESLSTAVFSSVTVEGGLIAPEADEAMRLLIYGDSITCGHSNMRADNAPDACNSTNENGLLTYAMRTAAMLNADAHVFAKSGLGLYTDPYAATIHLKDIYDKVSPGSNTDWDMTSWIPDAVVINIGTNDIWAPNGSAGDPPYTTDGFVAAYIQMVLGMVDAFGDQVTFFLCSSMMAADLDGAVQRVSEELLVNHGITAYFVDLPHQMNPSGHPTNASHEAAAEVLYRAITDRMGY